VTESAGPRLSFRRTGGLFAGNELAISLSPEELPAERARELEKLVGEADLPSLAKRSPIQGSGADTYQYELVLEGEHGPRHVVVDQTAIPEELRPLIKWLEQRAEEERRAARGR
jgi:emfourin